MLRRRLILGVLVTAPRDWKKLRDAVEETAAALGMTVEVDRGVGDNRARRERPLPRHRHRRAAARPRAMAAVAGRIADSGANIDRIERMARYPVTAIDLHVSGADPDALRTVLAAEAARQGIDIAVQPANLLRRGMRLIVMDVDSTLIQGEVIEMLAAHAGCEDRGGRRSPRRAMRGELDFEESLRARVALLAGLDAVRPRRRCTTRSCSPRAPAPWCAPCAGSATASRSSPAASARSPTGSPPTSASTTRAPTSSRSSTAG